jgi:phage terminase large subunit-like protein
MCANASLIESLASLSASERNEILRSLSADELTRLEYDWHSWARPPQLIPPGDWRTWLILAGRGFGKSKTGAQTVCELADNGHAQYIALIGQSIEEVQKVMIEGESGILRCYPPGRGPIWQPSKNILRWNSGAMATVFSASEPDKLRGPNHDFFWADELAKYSYPQETWDNLQLGLRLGDHPRGIVTTTPRPISTLRDIVKDPTTYITRGSTYENAANLAPKALQKFRDTYEGTRLGRQELHAELLDELPGALWQREKIDSLRLRDVHLADLLQELTRIVVAIDPATTSEEDSDETGIIACGRGRLNKGYVLADRSTVDTPNGWATTAIQLYYELHADAVVAEVNQGGEMVASTIRNIDANVRVIVVHAWRGKGRRAEPIAALYERDRVHHFGKYNKLEDQMCNLTVDGYGLSGSPDRADALCHGMAELFSGPSWGLFDIYKKQAEAAETKKAAAPIETKGAVSRTNEPPNETMATLSDAQKRDAGDTEAAAWMSFQKPVAPGKVSKIARTEKQPIVCTQCGNKGVQVFSETWRCGNCGTTGRIAQ